VPVRVRLTPASARDSGRGLRWLVYNSRIAVGR